MSLFLALGASLLLAPSTASVDVQALHKQCDSIAKSFRGRLGYRVETLDGEIAFGYRDEERFPSASTIKTVVMLEVVRQIEDGKLKWTDKLEVPPPRSGGGLWTGYLKPGTQLNIEMLCHLMMSVSDNTATVMLSDRVGVTNIEKRMLGWGLNDTACTINVPQDHERLAYLRRTFANMGVTSPSDMAKILKMIVSGKAASQAGCERIIRTMTHQYWDDFIASSVPPGVAVASKVGALNRSRSDTAIVFGEKPYILTVYTDNAKDRNWTNDNEGNVAIRKISSVVWNGLNPGRPYSPPTGAKLWYPTGGDIEVPQN